MAEYFLMENHKFSTADLKISQMLPELSMGLALAEMHNSRGMEPEKTTSRRETGPLVEGQGH